MGSCADALVGILSEKSDTVRRVREGRNESVLRAYLDVRIKQPKKQAIK